LKGVWFQIVNRVNKKLVSNLPFKFNLYRYTSGLLLRPYIGQVDASPEDVARLKVLTSAAATIMWRLLEESHPAAARLWREAEKEAGLPSVAGKGSVPVGQIFATRGYCRNVHGDATYAQTFAIWFHEEGEGRAASGGELAFWNVGARITPPTADGFVGVVFDATEGHFTPAFEPRVSAAGEEGVRQLKLFFAARGLRERKLETRRERKKLYVSGQTKWPLQGKVSLTSPHVKAIPRKFFWGALT
jgi:hypothetical protein